MDKLLVLQESYWKQRSRADWLKEGDRNTKKNHHKASTQKRNNHIPGIQSPEYGWINNDAEVNNIFLSYFSHLFTTSTPTQHCIDAVLIGINNTISEEMRSQLDVSYPSDEITTAVFGMAPWKSPGPDGFHAGFYQSNWDILGQKITDVCLHILNDGISIGALNSTYLVLIPKTKNQKLVSEYRPISICNVVEKIVAKAIANRLKICRRRSLILNKVPSSQIG